MRLVIANARDAEKWGADIKVQTKILSLKKKTKMAYRSSGQVKR
ncbi:hypothetical protein MCY_00858 [Bartonella rattimassiliensis 15908]|uniref:Uncharacterized protein n=1 Tax=Bartonella rattimassiliensis 15908 TaxID=1094556 RepID=J1JP18_9HYPH|nr:hypothetical protein MCY_00858 [Bartonella rattimassiliensis 15908]